MGRPNVVVRVARSINMFTRRREVRRVTSRVPVDGPQAAKSQQSWQQRWIHANICYPDARALGGDISTLLAYPQAGPRQLG